MSHDGDLARFVVAQEDDDLSVFSNADDATYFIEAEDALSGAMKFVSGGGAPLRPIRDATSKYGWRLERGGDELVDLRPALVSYASGIESVGTKASRLATHELLQLAANLQDEGRSHRNV